MKTVTRWEDMSKLMQQEDDALEALYEEREAAEYRALEARIAAEDAALLKCDGSGVIDEYYTDVDQTNVTKCPGCPACELAPAMACEASDEAPTPMWMGEETPRRPMLPELDPTFKFISFPERMAS